MTEGNQIIHGDSLEILKTLADNSVDALVCDPPAGIGFMQSNTRTWDSDKGGRDQWVAWLSSIMSEAYRMLKPGAHGLVWSLPRTSHWTALALEEAGFEIRDNIYHLYSRDTLIQEFMATLDAKQQGMFERIVERDPLMLHCFGSGFPKSHNISTAIDKYYTAEREIIGTYDSRGKYDPKKAGISSGKSNTSLFGKRYGETAITAPSTIEAKTYQGYGSALKPACECWWMVRKPLSEKSIAENVLRWGTGGINIDGCRIGTSEDMNPRDFDDTKRKSPKFSGIMNGGKTGEYRTGIGQVPNGRFPSHLLLSHTLFCAPDSCVSECPVAEMDRQSGNRKSGGRIHYPGEIPHQGTTYGVSGRSKYYERDSSEGGASRYFAQFYYASKASRRDRSSDGTVENTHPTCKNTELMRYLVRLISPPGESIILDPFAGSGTTGLACIAEGKRFILVEREKEYIDIMRARIGHAERERR